MLDPDQPLLARAVGLYMDGIRDGKPREAVAKHTGAVYRQHSTGVPDGQEGFIEFFEDFLQRNPQREIRVVRGWQDGHHVFVHVYQSLGGGEAQWVTADFFDTDDDGKIIEHWDVITQFVGETSSGRTNVDGPSEIVDLERTDPNKALVRECIETLLMRGGDSSAAERFISAEKYVPHSAEVAGGLAPLVQRLRAPDRTLWYERIVLLVGRGNFVATLCEVSRGDQRYAHVDVFRLEDGRVVEHWDAVEPCPPPDELANSGKF